MSNILENLYIEYDIYSNNKIPLSEKIKLLISNFSITENLPLFYIGVLNDFIMEEPQYYFNKNVKNEVIENLNKLYDKDKNIFLDAFYKNLEKFFYSLNSYYSIIDLYNEFDDIGIENITKAKIYYIPLITQLMEYCLNHFYRGIASIEGILKNKDYSTQNTLGKLKNILTKNYPNLLNIDIDFRDALSHGMLDIKKDKIDYSYIEKGTRKKIIKELNHYDLDEYKNNLIDIASGALVGLFIFMIEKQVISQEYLDSIDEKITFEFFKLLLHNENIKIKSYSKGIIGSSQFNIHINIKNINNKNQLIHVLIIISKIMYIVFPNYERYYINYSHPYSIDGMVSFENRQLEQMILTNDISELNSIISEYDYSLLIPDINDTYEDNRSYKFHTFPKISGKYWEVSKLQDISTDTIKRFKAKLLIDKENISKKELIKLLFYVNKKIKTLENKKNPQDKIKYGKMEADLVRLEVFYRMRERGNFALLKDNQYFICLVHYYKNRRVTKIEVPFQNNYYYEKIKKFDIYWNKAYNG